MMSWFFHHFIPRDSAMTEKLSTDKLKEMITTWLSVPEAREDLRHHSECDHKDDIRKGFGGVVPDMTWWEWTLKIWKAPKSCKTEEDLEKHIWKLWCDGKHWKRQEKRQWGDEAEFSGHLYFDGVRKEVPDFPCDMLGTHNQELVQKFFADPEAGKKCIYRLFSPDNELADNYRLEVVTTPDDTEVVGWWVTVD